MPIVGFNLEKTLAERKNKLQKGMKATHNITITSVQNEDIKQEETVEITEQPMKNTEARKIEVGSGRLTKKVIKKNKKREK